MSTAARRESRSCVGDGLTPGATTRLQLTAGAALLDLEVEAGGAVEIRAA